MTGTTTSTRTNVIGATLAILLAALSPAPSSAAAAGRRLLRADFPAAMAPLPDGGMLYGELRTGRIWRVAHTGDRARRAIARVRVSASEFAGLLGLAVDPRGRVFAAYTSATVGRLVVDRVAPGRARRIWTGPATASETNGGRLAFTPAGRLLITVGDRLLSLGHGPPGQPFPPWPNFNGSILSLDPNGPGTQAPHVLSSGWFNPYGLAVSAAGAVWAADNAPIGQPDHIARNARNHVLRRPAPCRRAVSRRAGRRWLRWRRIEEAHARSLLV